MRQLTQKKYFGLGQVPIGIGAVLRGRDLTEAEYRDPNRLPVVDTRIMGPSCPHKCIHCFTGKKPRTLTLAQIKRIIDELAQYKPRGIELEGEGEPTVDPWFFEIVEYVSSKGIVPTVYTEAATKLRDRDFARRLKNSGASVCVKIDSFYTPEYEDWITGTKGYFEGRNRAIEILIEEGFNESNKNGTTRLGFLKVVTTKNIEEIPKILRYCRDRNIWICFNTILPSGEVLRDSFDGSLLVPERKNIKWRGKVVKIDQEEYDFEYQAFANFCTAPCPEWLLIHADGHASVCPGNLERIGDILTENLDVIIKRVKARFPERDPSVFDGNCSFRPKIGT